MYLKLLKKSIMKWTKVGDYTIKLDLEQETSSVIPGSEVTGITTRKRSIKTSVLVDDGGILVLGGLIQETMNEGESTVSLLGDIPLLGALFRSTSASRNKQNQIGRAHV